MSTTTAIRVSGFLFYIIFFWGGGEGRRKNDTATYKKAGVHAPQLSLFSCIKKFHRSSFSSRQSGFGGTQFFLSVKQNAAKPVLAEKSWMTADAIQAPLRD